MDHTQIIVAAAGGTLTITLNRPERRNALTLRMQQELAHALMEADEDNTIHSVVLRGAGQNFCSGHDLEQLDECRGDGFRTAHELDDDAWHLERQQRLRLTVMDMHKPVIAQIHGACIAGGADLALLCDMVIAAEDARIGYPPVRDLGSPPNQLWLYHCGPQWTKRLLLTGDSLTGADAARIGLVMKAVPADLLEAEVAHLTSRLALIDPHLLSANKRIVNIGLELMGFRTLQRLAAENDARAHNAPGTRRFRKTAKAHGAKRAVKERDAAFGSGYANVTGPDKA